MDGRNFLDVAFDLVGEFREADWRSGVSRAYYAAYHVANEFMRRCGFIPRHHDDIHGFAWVRLANSKNTLVQQAGNTLRDVRVVRNQADYDLQRSFTQLLATRQVRLAEDVIRALDQAIATPSTLAQIIPVMRDFERDVLGVVTWQATPP